MTMIYTAKFHVIQLESCSTLGLRTKKIVFIKLKWKI